jgi:acyl transferase domain-containing protein
VDWGVGDVRLLTEQVPWPETDVPRRAGVSSFGISGTNAHVLLESVPDAAPEPTPPVPGPVPWLLSAQSAEALRAQAARLADHLLGQSPVDVGFSLATTRAALTHRAVVLDEAGLRALAAGEPAAAAVTGVAAGPARAVFVFPGQGAQWVGMARELWGSSAVFAESMEECERAFGPFVDWSLRDVVASGEFSRVDVVQPVLFAVMVSVAGLWRSFGVRPAAVVGHSQGEIAAAVVAGALSLQDGARVVCLRSRAIRDVLAGKGGMAAVSLPVDEVPDGDYAIAAVNGPASIVLSGDTDALDALLATGVRGRRVDVDYASHSSHVELLRERLLTDLAPIRPRTATVPLVSTVTGEPIDTAEMDAGYWYRNLRQTVRFADAIRSLVADGHATFLETSPHPVLTVGIEDTVGAGTVRAIGSLRRDDGGLAGFHRALATAYVNGVTVDWTAAYPGARTVDLPTYPFQRQRFWVEGELEDVDAWRYRVSWTHLNEPVAPAAPGRWLVVGDRRDAWVGRVVAALGTDVEVVDPPADRAELAARLAGIAPVDGVLSLVDGPAETAAVAQALGDAGMHTPLWCGTRAAADSDGVPAALGRSGGPARRLRRARLCQPARPARRRPRRRRRPREPGRGPRQRRVRSKAGIGSRRCTRAVVAAERHGAGHRRHRRHRRERRPLGGRGRRRTNRAGQPRRPGHRAGAGAARGE